MLHRATAYPSRRLIKTLTYGTGFFSSVLFQKQTPTANVVCGSFFGSFG